MVDTIGKIGPTPYEVQAYVTLTSLSATLAGEISEKSITSCRKIYDNLGLKIEAICNLI